MYDYKFIRVDIGMFKGKPSDDYAEIVKQQSKEGWRLKQLFSPPSGAYGQALYVEIVLEKEV